MTNPSSPNFIPEEDRIATFDMDDTFDWFGEESHPDYKGITEQQFKNRMILLEAMLRHGFKPLDSEWWHFTLRNEPYPETYFNIPVRQL